MKPIFTYTFALLILSSCTQESNRKTANDETAHINDIEQDNLELDDTTIIVLLELESTFLKRMGRSKANLTDDEYSQLERLLENHLEAYNKEQENRFAKLELEYPDSKLYIEDFTIELSYYRRQYVAYFNENGEKEVWINCFCFVNNNDDWKKAVFFVSDGGNCFFDLTVNLTLNNVLAFSVNGYA
jgi:hypothetical protein